MAYEENTHVITMMTNAALLRYRFVKMDSSARVGYAGVDARAEGVSQQPSDAADRSINVAIGGVPMVEVGSGGCTAGGKVATGANGTAVTADSGAYVMGTFMKTGVAGDIVPMLFNPSGPTY